MALSELLLQSGVDILFKEAQVVLHQPTIKEISYITEEGFYGGCSILNFSKEKISIPDKTILDNVNNFEIFMSVINEEEILSKEDIQNMKDVLGLIFPRYKIKIIHPIGILLTNEDGQIFTINQDNFENFKVILREMFCLNSTSDEKEYNPAGDAARKIVEKIQMGRLKKNQGKDNQKINILARYISILSVGLQKDKNDLLNYTIPQLFDEFNRFQLKLSNDFYYQAKMAGATDLNEVDPWMKDMYKSE